MSEKELIKKWKELKNIIEESNSQITNENNSRNKTTETSQQVYGGKTKVLSTLPKTQFSDVEINDKRNHNGYASALLLGFLTLIFQVLFMTIMYIIIK